MTTPPIPTTWPSPAAQQRICKRRDTAMCALAGAPGCELCMPCRYSDAELAARRLPVQELRDGHARRDEENPLHCGECFGRRDRPERESLVADHLASLYREPDEGKAAGLRIGIGRIVSRMKDADLVEARDWTGHEWRQWLDANVPPSDTDEDGRPGDF